VSVYSVKDVLHRIRVRLIPNNLRNVQGAYIASVNNEAELSLEEVAAASKNRGGFTGNYLDMVEHVRQFLLEMAYQLCDGFAVNLGWFSIRPVVGGGFETAHEGFDPGKHPVSFRCRIRAPLSDLARLIVVEMEGPADILGRIGSFTDFSSGAVNGTFTPGGLFSVGGRKIKVAGSDPDCGVWFVSKAKPARRYKVTHALAENLSTKLIGLVPALPEGEYGIEVKTQYTVGGKDLKRPRTVKSGFTLTNYK
jgi:hypothetical protein